VLVLKADDGVVRIANSKAGGTKAASIANAILRSGGEEGVAIATANKYANKHAAKLKKRGQISERAANKRGL
jgi:hypothetical protein